MLPRAHPCKQTEPKALCFRFVRPSVRARAVAFPPTDLPSTYSSLVFFYITFFPRYSPCVSSLLSSRQRVARDYCLEDWKTKLPCAVSCTGIARDGMHAQPSFYFLVFFLFLHFLSCRFCAVD